MPHAADELVAIDAIRQLKARYCRFVDTKQWDRLTALFAPEARLEGFGSVPDGADPATFVAAVSRRLAQAITVHHVHEPEISIIDPDRARGIWPMMDYVDFQRDGQPADTRTERGWIGWGYYEEDYVRSGGEWRISFMRLARLRLDALTADHPAAKPGRLKFSAEWI